MSKEELEKRVLALEQKVLDLQAQLDKPVTNGNYLNPNGPWWRDGAGRFADDPAFEEAARLGKEYRDSLHPDYAKKKRKARKKNAGA